MAKLEEQVLTIDQMNHLKELGLEVKDTAMCWVTDILGDLVVVPYYNLGGVDKIPTLTLLEILELLPEEIKYEGERAFLIYDKEDDTISYTYEDYDGNLNIDVVYWKGDGFLVNAYSMLVWCLENGYLKEE